MTPEQMDQLVTEYLDRVANALRQLPKPLRAQVMEGVATHVAEARSELRPRTEAELRDLLDRVGEPDDIAAAARGESDGAATPAQRRLPIPFVVTSALCCTLAVAALAFALGRTGSGGPPTTSTAETSPTALLSYVPKPTGPLLLATGRAGGLEWEFWAQESPLSGDVPVTATRVSGVLSPPMFAQRGLCTFIFFVHAKGAEGGSGPCGDPRQLSRFQFGQQGPGTDLNAAMLLGVTSLPAEWVRIGFSGATPALVVKTLAPRQLPGVRFFVASLPDSAMTSIEALGPRNNVVYRYSQQLPLVPLTTWQAHG